MAIKWPSINGLGRRSGSSAEERSSAPAGASVPSAPADPGWRSLPPVQRTIGAIELTAPPRSFTSSLATAQDPALISANRPTLLTTGSSVSVLRMAETQSDPVAAQHTPSPPAPPSRQWMPPLNIQRAGLGTGESAPQPAPPLMSSDAIEPYIDTPSASFVDAPDPDEPRPVPVVDHVEPSWPSLAVADVRREPAVQRAVEPTAPTTSAQPDRQVAADVPMVAPTRDAPVVSAVQRTVVDDAVTADPAIPDSPSALRAVPVVEFGPPGGAPLSTITETTLGASPASDTAARASAVARHVGVQPVASPLQRTADDGVSAASPPALLVTPASGSIPVTASSHPSVNALQRSAVGAGGGDAQLATSVTPEPVQRTISADAATAEGAHLPVVAERLAPQVGGSASSGTQPLSGGPAISVLQRAVSGGPGEAAGSIRPAAPLADDGPRTCLTSFVPAVEFPGAASPADFSAPVAVQRSSVHVDAGQGSTHRAFSTVSSPQHAAIDPVGAGPHWTPTVFESPIARPDTPTVQRALRSGTPASPPAAAAPVGLPRGTALPTAQRTAVPEARGANPVPPVMALPVVQRDMDVESDTVPAPFSTASHMPSRLVDGPSSSGRIVLLPPVRTETSQPAGGTREVFADSSRPMSLQRMFGDFARPTTGPDVVPPGAQDEHATVQTMTSDEPTAQRQVTSEPELIPVAQAVSEQTGPEPASSAPAGAAPAAAHGAAPSPADVDALVGRLYEPLAARLRAELWLDRERAGALMDLHR